MVTPSKIHPRGFTLIELLVVISIISLLSSVVLSSLNSARTRATNAKVVSEKRAIEFAVQSFFTSTGNYPYPGDMTYHCLASSNCRFSGISFAPSTAGDLSSIINSYLPSRVSINPTMTVSNLAYAGPLYICNTVSGGKCTSASLYWTISASTCPIGETLNSNSTGALCRTNAAGTGSGGY